LASSRSSFAILYTCGDTVIGHWAVHSPRKYINLIRVTNIGV